MCVVSVTAWLEVSVRCRLILVDTKCWAVLKSPLDCFSSILNKYICIKTTGENKN